MRGPWSTPASPPLEGDDADDAERARALEAELARLREERQALEAELERLRPRLVARRGRRVS